MPCKICAEGGRAVVVLVGRRCVVALACLVLLSGSAAHAQERTGAISGRVTDSRGEPQRLQVHLLTSGDIPAEDTYTASNGVFTFRGLPGGVYYVIVEAAGFRPFRETVRLDLHVNPSVQVNITLEPLEKERQETSPIISNAPQSYKFNAKRPGEFNPKALQEFNQANAKQQRGDVKGAIAHYQKAIRIAPDFYPALNNLGIIFLRQHNFADARTYFEKSLSVNPDDGEAYINFGHLLYEEGRYREAIERLKEGLQRAQTSPPGHFLLGSAYLKLGHFDEAKQNLKRACSLDPAGMAVAHLQLANLYLMQHNMEEAKTELETYLQAHPGDPQAPAIKKMLAGISVRPIN